jgi:hypothetical protein
MIAALARQQGYPRALHCFGEQSFAADEPQPRVPIFPSADFPWSPVPGDFHCDWLTIAVMLHCVSPAHPRRLPMHKVTI